MLIAAVACVPLLLSGCTQSDESRANAACLDEAKSKFDGDKVEMKNLEMSSLSDVAMEDGGATEVDHSKNVLFGMGDVHVWNGSVEKKIAVTCGVVFQNGDLDSVNLAEVG